GVGLEVVRAESSRHVWPAAAIYRIDVEVIRCRNWNRHVDVRLSIVHLCNLTRWFRPVVGGIRHVYDNRYIVFAWRRIRVSPQTLLLDLWGKLRRFGAD